MQIASREVKFPCPFHNLSNLHPCPMMFLLETVDDIPYVSHHLFSHIPQVVHDKVAELFSSIPPDTNCPFNSYCSSIHCRDLKNKTFYSRHRIEITVLILMMVVDKKDKLIAEIIKFAPEDIKAGLEGQLERALARSERSSSSDSHNFEEPTTTHANRDTNVTPELEEGEIEEPSRVTTNETNPVPDQGSDKPSESTNQLTANEIEEINNEDPYHTSHDEHVETEDSDSESDDEEAPAASESRGNILQIARRRDKSFQYGCSQCISVFLTIGDLYQHISNFHCEEEDSLSPTIEEMSPTEEEERDAKKIEVRMFDLTYSKKYNRRICRSWQQFTLQQSDDYLIELFSTAEPEPCKMPSCDFVAENPAEIMKHIRHTHVKEQ